MALTLQPNSPTINYDGDSKEWTYHYKAPRTEDLEPYIPIKNSPNPNGPGFFSNAVSTPGPGYTKLSLTYGKYTKSGTMETRANADTEYTCRVDMLEKALETRRNQAGVSTYRMKWNHNIYSTDSAAVTSSWYDTAALASDVPDKTTWIWAKDHPGSLNEKPVYLIAAMTKQGVESYSIPSPVITERKFYRHKSDASAQLLKSGRIATPGELFVYTAANGYNGEWLVVNSYLEFDGEFWVMTAEYTYADNWDNDLYD